MKNREMITSGQIKRQVLHLTQLENMIDLGYQEYQRYYEEVLGTMENISDTQLLTVKSMLELTLSSKKKMMSEIEKDMYLRSIEKVERIKQERFTVHKELCSKVEMG